MLGGKLFAKVANFFRTDVSEIIGAFFYGGKLFVLRMTDKIDSAEIDVKGNEPEYLAEKISAVCKERGWKTSAIGFCMQDDDVVTYQTAVDNIPEKEIAAFVKSWAVMQDGEDAMYSFTKVGEEIWMESLKKSTADNFCAAFEKHGLNLRALSVMPADAFTKVVPFERTKFISEVVRENKTPNFLSERISAWNHKKFPPAIAAVFIAVMLIGSVKLFVDCNTAEKELTAAKISIDKFGEEIALKEIADANILEMNRLNSICAAQKVTTVKFNLLINLGKVAGGGVRLTKVHAEENFLEIDGIAATPDAVKSYLSRLKTTVTPNVRLESSNENDDGNIEFTIRQRDVK